MKCDRFASMLLILCMVLAGCTGPAAPEAGATAAEQPAPEATAAKEAELVTMLVFPPDDVALYAEASIRPWRKASWRSTTAATFRR